MILHQYFFLVLLVLAGYVNVHDAFTPPANNIRCHHGHGHGHGGRARLSFPNVSGNGNVNVRIPFLVSQAKSSSIVESDEKVKASSTSSTESETRIETGSEGTTGKAMEMEMVLINNGNDVDVDDDENNNNNNNNMDIISEFLPTLGLLWVVALLSALDRVAMSVAILPLSTEYHLTDTIKGQISSIFSVGYGLAILPCGLLASRVSPRLIMGVGVALWSAATFGTPIAASLIQLNEINNAAANTNPEVAIATTIFIAANVTPLLFTRAIMGAAESVVLPATQRLLANWVPQSMKTIAVATVISGFQCGTVSAYLLSPWVMENFGGWRGLFFVYGVVGALWLVPWVVFSKDYPAAFAGAGSAAGGTMVVEECSTESAPILVNTMSNDDASLVVEEQCLDENETSRSVISTSTSSTSISISTDTDESSSSSSNTSAWEQGIQLIKDAPWTSFAQSPAVWAMIVAHAANNWGLYNMLSWTPTFYTEQYGLNVKESAFLSVFPSIAGAVCGLSAGFLADKIIASYSNSGSDSFSSTQIQDVDVNANDLSTDNNYDNEVRIRTNVRKGFQGLALLGPAACLLALSSNIPEDPSTAQALLMGTVGLQAFNAAGYGSSPQEKAGEKWSGLLYSITTLPGVIFGSLGVYVTGQILDMSSQDWSQVFSLNAGIDIVGALAFIALYNSKKEFD